jgi:HEAT repeat protein
VGCGDDAASPRRPDPLAEAALLRDENPATRREAVGRLEALGPAAAPAVPALIDALGDPDRWVREGAGKALAAVGPGAAAAVPALMKTLSDEDDYVRVRAAQALGAIGPAAKEAIPLLEFHAADPDESEGVHLHAKDAVRRIRGLPPDAPR